MSTDTAVKDTLTTETSVETSSTAELNTSEDSSKLNDSSMESKQESESTPVLETESKDSTTSTNTDSSQSSSSIEDQEYKQKLIEQIDLRIKEAYEDLASFEKRNHTNISFTTVAQTKKRSCLLESDHENLNFLFEYIVYLNKRKKEITNT